MQGERERDKGMTDIIKQKCLTFPGSDFSNVRICCFCL